MLPNACHGADISSIRAIGGRSWPRYRYRPKNASSGSAANSTSAPSREPKGASASGLTSEEPATSEEGRRRLRAPGGEWDNRVGRRELRAPGGEWEGRARSAVMVKAGPGRGTQPRSFK